ncbi:MAG: S9 family peptidase, partial [Clostridia bacterium]
MARQMAPYGSWKSPITTDFLVSQGVSLDAPMVDGHDVYWAEGRPQEGGRQVIVRLTADGRRVDVNPMPFNARTRAHEYGGGAYLAADGVVYFSNFEDQRLYRVTPGSEPQAVTAPGEVRFADFVLDSGRNRLIAVREDHGAGAHQAVSTLVAVSLDAEDHGIVLVAGNDFYAAPRLSPDGQKLCWLTWNHSNMPWDGTELYVAAIRGDGSIGAATLVA